MPFARREAALTKPVLGTPPAQRNPGARWPGRCAACLEFAYDRPLAKLSAGGLLTAKAPRARASAITAAKRASRCPW